jgi:hypothetical protein
MLTVDWSFSIPVHEGKMIWVTDTGTFIFDNSHAIFYLQAIALLALA